MAEPLKLPIRDPNVSQLTADTLVNLMSGMGTSKDKRSGNRFVFGQIDPAEAEAMYRNDWLAASVVDSIPDDMTRKWRTVEGLEPDQVDELQEAEEAFKIAERVNLALKWARLYGGCGIIMGIDGTGEMHEPLDPRRVKRGALKWLQVVDRNFLIAEQIEYLDPSSPRFGMPERYRAHAGPDLIHRSRILVFPGTPLPYRMMIQERFWGSSILERVRDAIANAASAQDGVASLILEAKVDVFKIPNLFQMLGTPQGTTTIMERFQLAQMGKSIHNAIILDKEEEYEQKTDALAQGLAGLVEQFLSIVAAASDIPVTRLLGTSAKGMNATGEGDARNYYDTVSAQQKNRLEPQLCQLDEVMLRSLWGAVPDSYDWSFPSLWQLSEGEQADVDLKNAQRDQTYLQEGVILPEHAAANLEAAGTYTTLDADYVEALEGVGSFGSGPGGYGSGEPAPGPALDPLEDPGPVTPGQ